jgi:hypothetical protein
MGTEVVTIRRIGAFADGNTDGKQKRPRWDVRVALIESLNERAVLLRFLATTLESEFQAGEQGEVPHRVIRRLVGDTGIANVGLLNQRSRFSNKITLRPGSAFAA